MKKTALGLTLALTMSTAIACAPADDQAGQADNYNQGYRGANYQQYGTQDNIQGYGQNQNRNGTNFSYGQDNRYRGQFGGPGIQGQNGNQTGNRGWGGLFGGRQNQGLINGQQQNQGLSGQNQGLTRGQNQGLTGQNRGFTTGQQQNQGFTTGQNQGLTGGQGQGNAGPGLFATDPRRPGQNIYGGANGQDGTQNRFLGRNATGTDDGIRGGGTNLGGTGNRMDASRDRYDHGTGPFGFDRANDDGINDRNGANNRNLAQSISRGTQTIDGVEDAHVVVHGDDILVGIEAEDGQSGNELESKVRSAIEKRVDGKEIHVSSDQDMVERLGEMDQDLQDGQPIRNLADDIGDMIENFGRNVSNVSNR